MKGPLCGVGGPYSTPQILEVVGHVGPKSFGKDRIDTAKSDDKHWNRIPG